MSKTEKPKTKKTPVQKIKISKSILKTQKKLRELKENFCIYYAELPIQRLAAKFIGKDENTITNWKKKDKKFSDRLGMLESEWALNNSRLIKSKEWLLERIMKEYFAEKKEIQVDALNLKQFLEESKKDLP